MGQFKCPGNAGRSRKSQEQQKKLRIRRWMTDLKKDQCRKYSEE